VFIPERGIAGIPAIDRKSPLEFASVRATSRTQLHISCTQIPHILDRESMRQKSESVSEKLNNLNVTLTIVLLIIDQLITNDDHFFTSQIVV
jgi:hypothetical protein